MECESFSRQSYAQWPGRTRFEEAAFTWWEVWIAFGGYTLEHTHINVLSLTLFSLGSSSRRLRK